MEMLRNLTGAMSIKTTGLPAGEEVDVLMVSNSTSERHSFIAIDDTGYPSVVQADGTLLIDFPPYVRYHDDDYELIITAASGDGWFATPLNVRRYYWLPDNPTATDLLNERVVRGMIDAYTGGFYCSFNRIEGEGMGTDYYPLPAGTIGIQKVWHNNVLEFDSAYYNDETMRPYILSFDGAAATIAQPDRFNRITGREPLTHSHGHGDTLQLYGYDDFGPTTVGRWGESLGWDVVPHSRRGLFPLNDDFAFLLESGWKHVPQDIQDAAQILTNDLSCGKLDYLNRYISEYSTDQFKLRFSSAGFGGTGNKLVDSILSKYGSADFGKLGVL